MLCFYAYVAQLVFLSHCQFGETKANVLYRNYSESNRDSLKLIDYNGSALLNGRTYVRVDLIRRQPCIEYRAGIVRRHRDLGLVHSARGHYACCRYRPTTSATPPQAVNAFPLCAVSRQ